MKKLILIANVFFLATTIKSQQYQPIVTNNPFPKTITVSGSSEMEIIPDEIYVNVELKEYQKKGEQKKNIETIKQQFLQASKSAGIPDSLISIVSFAGSNSFFWKKRKKDPDLFANIVYQVKFKDSDLLDKLVEKLDDEATQNFLIVSVSHSKITEYRKQLKIAAVKAAKEKAVYLTDAIGEKLGEAITITEPHALYGGLPPNERNANMMMRSASEGISDESTQYVNPIDFKKIKLRFEVEVTFAVK